MTGSDRSEKNDDSVTDVWDEIDEFTSADPAEDESVSDFSEFTESDPAKDESVSDFGEFTESDPTEDEPVSDTGEFAIESTENRQRPDSDGLDDGTESSDVDEMFDEMDVSTVDGEALWDELANPEANNHTLDAAEADTAGVTDNPGAADTETVDAPLDGTPDRDGNIDEAVDRDSPDGEESVIDKRVYCQQCPYFTIPPEVRCTHDGTAIAEVLEDGQFRVHNCPVVTESGPDRTILDDGS